MEIKNQDQQVSGLNSTGELNLYLDLLAFSELSPEEQLAYRERLKLVTPEQVLETAEEFPGFVEAADPLEELPPSNLTSEPPVEPLPEFDPPACDQLAPIESTEMSEPVFEFLPDREQPSTAKAADEPLPPADLFKASGPLSITGFLFDPTSEGATRVLSLAVCPSCGSEAEGTDLFCVACGAFMVDEQAETEVIGSACDDCGLMVAADELICPACGSVSMVC
ncbi:MAG TPA: zinc ribbon domain-containing protein [Blastocatellia bacterium]|nr:zinc ribbon domain-containing protein [Blastocatellia bacterium]